MEKPNGKGDGTWDSRTAGATWLCGPTKPPRPASQSLFLIPLPLCSSTPPPPADAMLQNVGIDVDWLEKELAGMHPNPAPQPEPEEEPEPEPSDHCGDCKVILLYTLVLALILGVLMHIVPAGKFQFGEVGALDPRVQLLPTTLVSPATPPRMCYGMNSVPQYASLFLSLAAFSLSLPSLWRDFLWACM